MRRELEISIADLRHVSIGCPHCGTVVTLDMGREFADPHAPARFCPVECPGCRAAYDSAIAPAVDNLRKAYAALATLGERVKFRVAAFDS